MEVKKVLIDKAYAQHLLSNNDHNRRVKDHTVARYANDMLSGKWKEDTGELIKISKSNKLLDGQHRLMAVIKANVPIYFHVCYDLDDVIFDVIDTGTKRNCADIFYMEGIKNPKTAAAVIQSFNRLNNGKSLVRGGNHDRTLSNHEVLKLYRGDDAKFDRVVLHAERWYKGIHKAMPTSEIGGLYLYFSEIDKNDSFDFFNQLCIGEDIKNKTISLLRKKIIDNKIQNKHKMTSELKLALFIKTWNFYRRNFEAKTLSIYDGDENQKPI